LAQASSIAFWIAPVASAFPSPFEASTSLTTAPLP
jgi:hypothetical protein